MEKENCHETKQGNWVSEVKTGECEWDKSEKSKSKHHHQVEWGKKREEEWGSNIK